ncbi:MAG: hypothetical protein KGL55_05195 [Rhodospirillales bacterium]|nr:hypothetical protein [Rhodospirillales bacterium]
MADEADVETALVAEITQAVCPQGTGAPSVVGGLCRIFRGWPTAAALDADLSSNVANVTVFAERGLQRNTTRWMDEPIALPPVPAGLAVAVNGTTATFSGVATTGQVAGLRVDQVAVVHRTGPTDTPELVAAILAARLQTQRIVQVSGAAVTVPGAAIFDARIVADQPVLLQPRRQEMGFRISFWCPDPASRDTIVTAVDSVLATITFLPLGDGTGGRVRYRGSRTRDHEENARLYRRDLIYTVEYATTVQVSRPEMIFGATDIFPATAGASLNFLA